MKIVITGATSFIGYRFVKYAVEQNWDIVTVVRRNSPNKSILTDLPVEIIERDMDEYAELGSAVGASDCFVHFAWDGTRGDDRNNEEKQRRNYENSVRAIQSIIDAGCKCILTAGSQAEYGLCDGIIDEKMVCKPNTEYGVYKYQLYKKVKELCEKNEVAYKEPRFFSVYGPGDFKQTLVMSVIEKMKKNEDCNLTECIQKWDFLYIDDAVRAVAMLCEKSCPNGIYNLGSGDVRQLKEFVEEIKKILGSTSTIHYGVIPYPTTGMVSICPSIKKVSSELNWRAETRFGDGVRSILGAMR